MFEFSNNTGSTVAWGDESMRMHGRPPMYLLCATVFDEQTAESLKQLVAAKPAGLRKMHWYDMDNRERAHALAALADVGQWSAVAIASPLLASIRPERGRRKCLERILPTLEASGVSTLILESRWKQEDQADVNMAVALRNRKIISDIRIEHLHPGSGEVRLWVPDLVLGAIGDLLCGTGDYGAWGSAWESIDGRITVYPVPLT